MAKRRRSEKSEKIEQRKVQGPEWVSQGKQTALFASPIYIRQIQGGKKRNIKIEEPKYSEVGLGAAGGFSSFGSASLHASRMYFLLLASKLSYNAGLSLASHFCFGETEPRKSNFPDNEKPKDEDLSKHTPWWPSRLGFYCCPNKSLPIQWLKTAFIHHLSIFVSQKSGT